VHFLEDVASGKQQLPLRGCHADARQLQPTGKHKKHAAFIYGGSCLFVEVVVHYLYLY